MLIKIKHKCMKCDIEWEDEYFRFFEENVPKFLWGLCNKCEKDLERKYFG